MEDKMKTILNFKNPDEFKQLERQAYNGTLDVSDFPPAEYIQKTLAMSNQKCYTING